MSKFIDLLNFIAIEYLGNRKWNGKCNCKTEYVKTNELHKCLSGRVTKAMEKQRDKLNKILEQHDSRRDKVRYTLKGLRAARDRTKKNQKYIKNGITFSQEWDADMYQGAEDCGIRPPCTVLDRIDGRLGYVKGNTRWADVKSTGRNLTNGVFYKSLKSGEVKCLDHWADEVKCLDHWTADMGILTGITLKNQIKAGKYPDLVSVEYDNYVVQELEKHANSPNPYPDGTYFKNGDQERM